MNVVARQNFVYSKLETNTKPALTSSKTIIEKGLRFSPGEATLHSLLGTINEQLGNKAAAENAYHIALKLNAADRLALFRQFAIAIESKNYSSAVNISDVIFRRWPAYWSSIEPFLPAMLDNPAGFEQATKTFVGSPAIMDRLIANLSKSSNSVTYAAKLMREWKRRSYDLPWQLVNRVTNSLIWNENSAAAILFFHAMLPSEMAEEAKFVFNGQFNLDSKGNPFNWKLNKQTGVSQRIVEFKNPEDPEKKLDRKLEIRFQDSPIQYRGLSQTIALPAGSFKLNVEFSNAELKTPKPIRMNVGCIKPKKVLAILELSTLKSNKETKEFDFTVPRKNCALQEIYLDSEFVARSWRNRFKGILNIHSVEIKLLGG